MVETSESSEAAPRHPEPGSAKPFSVNHVGLVVPSIDRYLEANRLLYAGFQRAAPVINERQQVRELFITDGKSVIELLEPMSDSSPLAGFLRKNAAGGLVHLCFDCDDIVEAIRLLRAEGALLISGPTPDVAFDDRPIAFLFVARQVVELVERSRRAASAP